MGYAFFTLNHTEVLRGTVCAGMGPPGAKDPEVGEEEPPACSPAVAWVVGGVRTALCGGGDTLVGRVPGAVGTEVPGLRPDPRWAFMWKAEAGGLLGSHCRDTPRPQP